MCDTTYCLCMKYPAGYSKMLVLYLFLVLLISRTEFSMDLRYR